MKRLLALLAAAPLAFAGEIEHFALDAGRVTEIPVSNQDVTMITFPEPITGIMGAWCGEGKDDRPIKFQAQHVPGENFIAVRNVIPGQKAALSVIYRGQVFVLRLVSSDQPLLSAVFEDAPLTPKPVPADSNVAKTPKFDPTLGMNLLERAQLYPVLKMQLPEKVADVEHRALKQETKYSNITFGLTEAYRFPTEDGLVFEGWIKNETDRPLHFSAQSLGVRVGSEIYYQQVASASGEIPAKAKTPVRFAIVGRPDGGSRNDIAITNTFTPVVSITEKPAENYDLITGQELPSLDDKQILPPLAPSAENMRPSSPVATSKGASKKGAIQ